MNEKAFFFQGDNLLLPVDFPESHICEGVLLERAEDFETADIFEIPSLENPFVSIKVVSIPPQESQAEHSQAKPLQANTCENGKKISMRQVLTMFAAGAFGEPSNNMFANSKFAGAQLQISNLLRACHIAQWRLTSRFCGTCGAENCDPAAEDTMQLFYGNTDIATTFPFPAPPIARTAPLPSPHRVCPKCGREEYPRISPAMIVMITDDENRILLAHNKKFRTGVYSHISGFNEAGESLEETVVREVREEVNIEIKEIEYIKSQSWPFPNSLMIGFRAHYASGVIEPDGGEIEDAQWFTKDNLPEIPAEGSLSRWMINKWLAGG